MKVDNFVSNRLQNYISKFLLQLGPPKRSILATPLHTMPSMPRDGTVVNEVLDIMFKFEALVGFVTNFLLKGPVYIHFGSNGVQVCK